MRIFTGSRAALEATRIAARQAEPETVEKQVRRIVSDVRRRGDAALRRYAQRWDHLAPDQPLQISIDEMSAAQRATSSQTRIALRRAAENIRRFCIWQKPKTWTRNWKGASLGQLVRPLDSVGCYVPGGRYPLVSTLLMTVIPAQVAGVKNIRVVSPRPSNELLAAAQMLGVREFYRVGGAHAISALAYGTATIPRVDKIVGPGNSYVTAAKKLISFDCAIDMLAGPTEAVILSSAGDPRFIAADLISQAEHDPEAIALLLTTSRKLGELVASEVDSTSKGNEIACASLRGRGAILVADSRQQARDWANAIAPEHITIDDDDLPHIRNAGSIFIGDYSAQAAGDYASGPNHVLPTGGHARFRAGLSVTDFVKMITVQRHSAKSLKSIAGTVECLAGIEGLNAHGAAIAVRMKDA